MFEAVLILNSSEMGIEDYPEAEESLMELLADRTIDISLSGTWEARGDSLYTAYQDAEVTGWDELVDDVMEVITPVIEGRLEGSTEDEISGIVSTFRGLLQSWFSVEDAVPFQEERTVSWSVEGDFLYKKELEDELGPETYRRVVVTAVRPMSWGEVKSQTR